MMELAQRSSSLVQTRRIVGSGDKDGVAVFCILGSLHLTKIFEMFYRYVA